MTEQTRTWEQSVEKARLALVKTFEGRVEAALASFEQIPPGSGRGGNRNRESLLAQFALDTGMELNSLRDYREITKWLGSKSATAGFDPETARYRAGDIVVYTLAREAIRSKKWKTGTAFTAFLESTDPPEPFHRWTVDALRVHLGQKPTNTGKLALKAAEGEVVTDDQQHAAAAKDAAEEAAEEIEQITNPLDRAEAAVDASATVAEAAPRTGEHELDQRMIEDMFGPLSRAHELAREYVRAIRESAAWLERHGDEVVGGGTDDAEDRPERIRDIARDGFQEDLGLIQDALTEVGVGTSITEGFDALLSE